MGGDVKQEKCVLVNADRNQFKNGKVSCDSFYKRATSLTVDLFVDRSAFFKFFSLRYQIISVKIL